MLTEQVLKYIIAMAPVIVFLAIMIRLDSHRLLGMRLVIWMIICGEFNRH